MNDSETPAAGPSAPAQRPAEESAPTTDQKSPEQAQQPPQRRRGLGSVRSMIISTVLVVLAVLGWWAWVPRADQTQQQVADVAGIAREVGLSKHWDPAVASGLPKGWTPVNVRLIGATNNEPDTWQAGYDAPGGSYARVVQTENGTAQWVRSQNDNSTPSGSVTVAGVRWDKYTRSDGGERSLVRAEPLAGLSTMVTGTTDWSELQQFAASLKPLSKSAFARSTVTGPATS